MKLGIDTLPTDEEKNGPKSMTELDKEKYDDIKIMMTQ